MIVGCPGSQKFRQPQPEFVKCIVCGEEVEIWTDEVSVSCPKCNSPVARRAAQSCLDWCKHAKECVGEERYKAYLKNKIK